MNNIVEFTAFKRKQEEQGKQHELSSYLAETMLKLSKFSHSPGYGVMCAILETTICAVALSRPSMLYDYLTKFGYYTIHGVMTMGIPKISMILKVFQDAATSQYYVTEKPFTSIDEALAASSVFTFNHYSIDPNDPYFTNQETGELNELEYINYDIDDLLFEDFAWYRSTNSLLSTKDPVKVDLDNVIFNDNLTGNTETDSVPIITEFLFHFLETLMEETDYQMTRIVRWENDRKELCSKLVFMMGLEVIEVATNYTVMSKIKL
jgi:hypothetical protein